MEKFQEDLLRLRGAFQEGLLTPDQFGKGADSLAGKFEKSLNIDSSIKSNGAGGSLTSSRVSVEGLARGQAGKVQKVESEQLAQIAKLIQEQKAGIMEALNAGGRLN